MSCKESLYANRDLLVAVALVSGPDDFLPEVELDLPLLELESELELLPEPELELELLPDPELLPEPELELLPESVPELCDCCFTAVCALAGSSAACCGADSRMGLAAGRAR